MCGDVGVSVNVNCVVVAGQRHVDGGCVNGVSVGAGSIRLCDGCSSLEEVVDVSVLSNVLSLGGFGDGVGVALSDSVPEVGMVSVIADFIVLVAVVQLTGVISVSIIEVLVLRCCCCCLFWRWRCRL